MMVPPARFELTACGLGNRRSIRLSYGGSAVVRTVGTALNQSHDAHIGRRKPFSKRNGRPACAKTQKDGRVMDIHDTPKLFIDAEVMLS